MLVILAGLPARPMDAIGAAAALTDRLDRLQVHQFGQVTPGESEMGSLLEAYGGMA